MTAYTHLWNLIIMGAGALTLALIVTLILRAVMRLVIGVLE
jgi:hypothetical protein